MDGKKKHGLLQLMLKQKRFNQLLVIPLAVVILTFFTSSKTVSTHFRFVTCQEVSFERVKAHPIIG